jgi:hypothetical protein
MNPQDKPGITFEQIKLKGSQLVEKVRELVEDGNTRRVVIKKDERVLMEVPLSVGVGGAAAAILFAPMLAALGALAALVTDVEVEIERLQPPAAKPEDGQAENGNRALE